MFEVTMECDELTESAGGHAAGFAEDDCEARICNPDAENGVECRGPLSWLNSASVSIDTREDAVHCTVNVGDPRGAFGFTVRRTPEGKLIIHTPYPGEGFAHMETTQLHPGTLEVKGNFADPPEEVDDDEEDDSDDEE